MTRIQNIYIIFHERKIFKISIMVVRRINRCIGGLRWLSLKNVFNIVDAGSTGNCAVFSHIKLSCISTISPTQQSLSPNGFNRVGRATANKNMFKSGLSQCYFKGHLLKWIIRNPGFGTFKFLKWSLSPCVLFLYWATTNILWKTYIFFM